MSPAEPFDPKNVPYRKLGASGLDVPAFSIGSWLTVGKHVNGDPARDIIKTCYENGINYIDTAEVYANGQSESELGRVIKELGYKRDELTIATKLYFGTGRKAPNTRGLSRKHIIEGMDASLERLGLTHVDIVHAHRDDESVGVEEIVRAFNHLINTGKAHYWGTSEWSAKRLLEAFEVAERLQLIGPVADQPQYSLLHRRIEKDYKPLFEKYNLGTTVWSPLNHGFLTGKYNDGVPKGSRFDTNKDFYKDTIAKLETDEGKAKIEQVKKLTKIAERLGCNTAQLSLAWAAKQPYISTVILGATKPEQIHDNLGAIAVIDKLTPDILKEIDAIFPPAA